MEKELKEMLQEVLDNQAILYQKLDILQSKFVENKTKSFYTTKKAKEDLVKDRTSLNS